MKSNSYVNTEFIFPEFIDAKKINFKFQLTENLGSYDIIIGRDLMRKLVLNVSYAKNSVIWDNMLVLLKHEDSDLSSFYIRKENKELQKPLTEKRILDAI